MIRIYWSHYFTCSKQAFSYNNSLQIYLYIHPTLHINASTITISSYFTAENILVLGNFNEDLMQNKTKISNYFKQHGYKQLIHQPTTDQESLLDHIYFNGTSTTTTEVCDTYYSDHDSTMLAIKKNTF